MSSPARPRVPIDAPAGSPRGSPVTGAGTVAGHGRVLGVDLGSRRIGVAVCDAGQRVATPIVAVTRREGVAGHRRALDELAELAAEHEAVGAVVGLPRSLSGALGVAAQATLAEVDALRAVLALPVETVDERFTTASAAAALRSGGLKARDRRAVIDASAAAVILQSWLDARVRSAP